MPDRAKVIEGLEHCDFGSSNTCYEKECPYYQIHCCTDELKNDILILLKEQETGWIGVKDRLPDRQDPVLVYVPPYTDENDEYVGYVGMAYYTSFGKKGFWGGTNGSVYGAIGIIHEPTHWKPLPEPPEKGK